MRKHLALTAAVAAAAALSLSACGDSGSTPTGDSTPTVNIGQEGHSAGDGHDHGADEHYGVPEVTWDAAAEKAVKDTSAKVMGLFARPDVPETTWFADLSPYLAPQYVEDARYIDPGRVPVRKVMEGPALTREAGNPLTVTATFATDNGLWEVALHRAGQTEPWLVTSISAKDNS